MTTAIANSFVPDKVLNNIDRINPENADKMPFGVTQVDKEGNIKLYNSYNRDEFADFKGQDVTGKNYFTDVAPCANNFMFSGRFKRGIENGNLNSIFDYLFTYKLAPTKVKVHLYSDANTGTHWIFVKKI